MIQVQTQPSFKSTTLNLNYPVLTPAQMTAGVPDAVAHDRLTAAGSPFKPVSGSTSLHLPIDSSSFKQISTAVDSQPVFVNLPNSAPRSYTVLKEVGDGSFGTVWLADWHSPLELPPGTAPPGPSSRPEYRGKKLVAIKRMKKEFNGGWDECMKLKELKSLRTIPMHHNMIPLYDAFLMPASKELYFVFECMEGNLYQLTKSRKGRPLAAGLIASIFHQILLGLDHVHSNGFFHRDMKPENLLITTTGLADYPPSAVYALPGSPFEKDVVCTVKIADFGLAREIKSKPPYTEYVSTRWYRAPEVLLRARDYSSPVDLWALGTIVAEMANLKPLFPGQSEVDQVVRICQILGDPATDYGRDPRGKLRGGGTWERGIKMAKSVGFNWPRNMPINFQGLFDQNTVPIQLIDCIAGLLRYNPSSRLTTRECLEHEYFKEIAPRYVPWVPEHQQVLPPTPTSMNGLPAIVNPNSIPNQPVPYHSPPSSGIASAEQQHARLQQQVHRQRTAGSLPEPTAPWERTNDPTMRRRQTAASSVDYYDGSIFEGIAPAQDVSLYNYSPVSTSSAVFAPNGSFNRTSFGAPSSIYDDEYSLRIQEEQAQREANQASAQAGPSKQSKGWSLSSLLPTQDTKLPAPTSLKRSTSQRSNHQLEPAVQDLPSKDAKKAKKQAQQAAKEADRARKEAERAKREAATLAARERARAVMQKKNQLAAKADFNNFQPNFISPDQQSAVAQGKMRAADSFKPSQLSQIAEDAHARLSPTGYDGRWKSRRRDDDDDVHSVSSNETRNSNEKRYPYLEPDQPSRLLSGGQLSRLSTGSSLGSLGSRFNTIDQLGHLQQSERPPGTSGSTVDHHLAQNFSGLTAAEHYTSRAGSTSPYHSNSLAESSAMPSPGASTTFNPALHSLSYQQAQTASLQHPPLQAMIPLKSFTTDPALHSLHPQHRTHPQPR